MFRKFTNTLRRKRISSSQKFFGTSIIDDKAISFVKYCASHILKYGIYEKGIFRVGGNLETVNGIVEKVENEAANDNPNFSSLNFENYDISDITSLLKLFLRKMENPLLTYELYDCFISAHYVENYDEKVESVKMLVYLLDKNRREILFILTDLLKNIASHEDKNFMGSQNLSLLIAPNILRPLHETPQTTIADARATFDIVNILIVNHDNFVISNISVRDTLELQRKLEGNYSQHKKVSLKVLDDLTKEMNIHESDLSHLSDTIVNGKISNKEFSETVFSNSEFRSKERSKKTSGWKLAVPSSSAQAKAIGETIDSDEEKEWASFQKDFIFRMFNLTRVRRRRNHSKFKSSNTEDGSSNSDNLQTSKNTDNEEENSITKDDTNNGTLTESEISSILKDLDLIFPSNT